MEHGLYVPRGTFKYSEIKYSEIKGGVEGTRILQNGVVGFWAQKKLVQS